MIFAVFSKSSAKSHFKIIFSTSDLKQGRYKGGRGADGANAPSIFGIFCQSIQFFKWNQEICNNFSCLKSFCTVNSMPLRGPCKISWKTKKLGIFGNMFIWRYLCFRNMRSTYYLNNPQVFDQKFLETSRKVQLIDWDWYPCRS